MPLGLLGKAGVPDEDATDAAAEVAEYEGRLMTVDRHLEVLQTKTNIVLVLLGLCLVVLGATSSVWAQEVAFPDPHLRAALRVALGTAPGAPLTPHDLAAITELDLSTAGITDLRGLEGARNLIALRLRNNAVQTLTPLADLGVERLDIGGNQIPDLGILATLPALREVRLGDNPVRDFSPVAPLVRTGLLVYWRPDTPRGPHTIRVAVDELEVAAKTAVLLGAALAPAEDAARGYVEVAVTDVGLELALRTGQPVVVVGPAAAPASRSTRAPAAPAVLLKDLPAAWSSPVASLVETVGIPGFPCYRTVEETYASAQALAATYPQLAEWIDAGDSWQKTQNSAEGYDLLVLRLTNEQRSGAKPRLFISPVRSTPGNTPRPS